MGLEGKNYLCIYVSRVDYFPCGLQTDILEVCGMSLFSDQRRLRWRMILKVNHLKKLVMALK